MTQVNQELHAVPLIHDRMSLNDILTAFDLHDQAIVGLTDEQLAQLMNLLVRKVDGCKYRLDQLADEAKRHAEYAKEHIEAKRIVENKIERLEERIACAMRQNNFATLPGEEFSLTLLKSERLEITHEPTLEHAVLLPELVRTKTTYAWEKTAVKKAIHKGMTDFPYGKITEHFSPQFPLNRKD